MDADRHLGCSLETLMAGLAFVLGVVTALVVAVRSDVRQIRTAERACSCRCALFHDDPRDMPPARPGETRHGALVCATGPDARDYLRALGRQADAAYAARVGAR